jgi:hypothetical protein
MASAPDLNASDSDDELHTCNSQCDHTDAPSIAPNLETYDLNAQQPVIADHELTDDWEKDSEEYRTYVEACKEIYCKCRWRSLRRTEAQMCAFCNQLAFTNDVRLCFFPPDPCAGWGWMEALP